MPPVSKATNNLAGLEPVTAPQTPAADAFGVSVPPELLRTIANLPSVPVDYGKELISGGASMAWLLDVISATRSSTLKELARDAGEPQAMVDKGIPTCELQYTPAAGEGLAHGTPLYTYTTLVANLAEQKRQVEEQVAKLKEQAVREILAMSLPELQRFVQAVESRQAGEPIHV